MRIALSWRLMIHPAATFLHGQQNRAPAGKSCTLSSEHGYLRMKSECIGAVPIDTMGILFAT